jgi:hypothetical protein
VTEFAKGLDNFLLIEERGQRLFACGGMAQSGHPMKQEPAEATAQLIA